MALGEQVEGGHRELERAAGSRGARVQAHTGALGGGVQAVAVEVAAEVEVVGGHPVVALQPLCEPRPGGHAVEPEAVRGLREQRLAAGGVEGGLVVLHQVEPRSPRGGGEDWVGGFPGGREDRVSVLDARGGVADLCLQRGPPGPHFFTVVLERPPVAVVEVDGALVPRPLQRGGQAEEGREPSRPLPRGCAHPRHFERLSGAQGQRRRERPATRGDLRGPHEVLARHQQPPLSRGGDPPRGAVEQAGGHAGLPFSAHQPPRLAGAVEDC